MFQYYFKAKWNIKRYRNYIKIKYRSTENRQSEAKNLKNINRIRGKQIISKIAPAYNHPQYQIIIRMGFSLLRNNQQYTQQCYNDS